MRIIAEAPCRVDLAGGTLDIWPLYLFHPGAVTVNFAINRFTRCAIETLDSPEIRLRSSDLQAAESYRSLALWIKPAGRACRWRPTCCAFSVRKPVSQYKPIRNRPRAPGSPDRRR